MKYYSCIENGSLFSHVGNCQPTTHNLSSVIKGQGKREREQREDFCVIFIVFEMHFAGGDMNFKNE